MPTLAVIGGGAAGLAAAIGAAVVLQHAKNGTGLFNHRKPKDVSIVVIEKDDRIGRTILATGNGRCNFSNAGIDLNHYFNSAFAADVFFHLASIWKQITHSQDDFDDPVLSFFHGLGLVWREEADGRLFPLSNKATSVLDVLRQAIDLYSIQIKTDTTITGVVQAPQGQGNPDRLGLKTNDKELIWVDSVIVTCGPALNQDLVESFNLGENFIPFHPRLGPLKTCGDTAAPLDNLRARCQVYLWAGKSSPKGSLKCEPARAPQKDATLKFSESGEVQFKKYGLSGIVIFNVSRHASKGDLITLDLFPHLEWDDAPGYAQSRLSHLQTLGVGTITCEGFCKGLLGSVIAREIIRHCGFKDEDPCTPDKAVAIVKALKMFTFEVESIGDPRQCQIFRGGVSPKILKVNTLEAVHDSRIHLAGEAIDVDGPCGGYNLEWAWTSGLLSGIQAMRKLLDD